MDEMNKETINEIETKWEGCDSPCQGDQCMDWDCPYNGGGQCLC